MVTELLQWDISDLEEIYATEAWVPDRPIPPDSSGKPRLFRVEPYELEAMSCQQSPNQVLALVRQKPAPKPVAPKGEITLALDAIRDPGNLGTIIRTADWFGIRHVICSPDCAELYNPKVVQATMGAIFRVSVAYTPLSPWISDLAAMPVWCATLDGAPLSEASPPNEAVLVIGNEAHGVSEETLSLATKCVTIPRYGHAESLNASVAAGILMSKLCQGQGA